VSKVAVVTGWLGGERVGRHGVGVHEGVHLDEQARRDAARSSAALGAEQR
jgi:hypothetical protein